MPIEKKKKFSKYKIMFQAINYPKQYQINIIPVP